MPVNIKLSPEREAVLRAQADAHGMILQEWLLHLAEEHVPATAGPRMERREPFWKAFLDRVHSVPEEAFEDLPRDGASEHDHYLYGSPKRN